MRKRSPGKKARRQARLNSRTPSQARPRNADPGSGSFSPNFPAPSVIPLITDWKDPSNVREALLDDLPADEFPADTQQLVADGEALDARLHARGWEFDGTACGEGQSLAWRFPPSEHDPDHDLAEPRTWFFISLPEMGRYTLAELPIEVYLAGHGVEVGAWRAANIETLFEQIEAIESYRAGADTNGFPLPYVPGSCYHDEDSEYDGLPRPAALIH